MGENVEIFPDVGCKEATRLWEKNKEKPDVLRSALIERHKEAEEHSADCFVNLVGSSA